MLLTNKQRVFIKVLVCISTVALIISSMASYFLYR